MSDESPRDASFDSEARVEHCLESYEVCLEAAHHFMEVGNEEHRCVRLLLDCAQICKTTADFIARGSNHERLSEICEKVCLEAARYWERHARSMDAKSAAYLRASAETARRCAESCRGTAGAPDETPRHALARAAYH